MNVKKLVGVILMVIGFLFGGFVTDGLTRLGLNITFYDVPVASLPLVGTIASFVVSTTFIGLNIAGIQIGINFVVFVGLILLIVF
jgi:hypothetical protein